MATRTGLSGYLQTFIQPVTLLGVLCASTFCHCEMLIADYDVHLFVFTAMKINIDYLPVYYQACKDASPIASGVDVFGIPFVTAPFAVIVGISITKSSRYRPQTWISWSLAIIGFGLFSTLNAETSRGRSIGFQVVLAMGLGMLNASTFFPVLAPLPPSSNGHALALFTFLRNFAQVCVTSMWPLHLFYIIFSSKTTKLHKYVDLGYYYRRNSPSKWTQVPPST